MRITARPLFVVVDEDAHPDKFAVHAPLVFDVKTYAANTVWCRIPGANNLNGAALSQPLAKFVSDYEAWRAWDGWSADRSRLACPLSASRNPRDLHLQLQQLRNVRALRRLLRLEDSEQAAWPRHDHTTPI